MCEAASEGQVEPDVEMLRRLSQKKRGERGEAAWSSWLVGLFRNVNSSASSRGALGTFSFLAWLGSRECSQRCHWLRPQNFQ